MRRLLMLMVLALVVLGLSGPANARTVERPFEATMVGGTSDIHWAPGFDLATNPWVTDTFDGRCPNGASWVIEFEGTGEGTIGPFTWSSSHCTLLTQLVPVPNAEIYAGEFQYVTRSGAVLHETYEAVGGITLEGDMLCSDTAGTFTGGTRQFRNATGSALEHGCWPADTPGPVIAEDELVINSVGTLGFQTPRRR